MDTVERIVNLVATIFGLLFSAGTFYFLVAQPLKWWPYRKAGGRAAGGTPVTGRAIIPSKFLIGFGGLGIALLASVFYFGLSSPAPQPKTIEEIRAQIDPPSPIVNYGLDAENFAYVKFNSTEIFRPWASKYRLLGISQILFTDIDRQNNQRIGKSVPYTIDGMGITMAARIEQDQINLLRPGQTALTELAVFLIPKSVDLDKIVSLQSAEDLGGIYVTRRIRGSSVHPTKITIISPNPAPK